MQYDDIKLQKASKEWNAAVNWRIFSYLENLFINYKLSLFIMIAFHNHRAKIVKGITGCHLQESTV